MSMTEMGDLSITLNDMGFVQLVLAFAFLISYALAIGGMFGALGRRRAAAAAFAAAIAFAAMTTPWVNGALLVVFAIAGVGLFITLAWALSLLFGAARAPGASVAEAPDVAEFAEITAAAALVDAEVPALSNTACLRAAAIAASQAGGAHTS
jgi:hypothetical protein